MFRQEILHWPIWTLITFVTDLNLTESKSANTDKDIEMLDPEKTPKRDLLEDVDMSNDDNEEEEMEANPNLNQSRISDYFPPTK